MRIFRFFSILVFIKMACPILAQDSIKRVDLEQVVVFGHRKNDDVNSYKYGKMEAKTIISVIGETDVVRYISTLPGVAQGMEGGMGLFVRGGSDGHNRFELDGVPVYGSTHLFGLFSVFHPDVVDDVEFRSGGFPASTGDFMASLTRIKTIVPDTLLHGSVGLSPFMVGASINGAISHDCGFVAAGRLSQLPLAYKAVKAIADTDADVVPQVGDWYAKLYWNVASSHSLWTSFYVSHDYFKFAQDNVIEMGWGNRLGQLTWNCTISPSMLSKIQLYVSDFYSEQKNRYYDDIGALTSGLRLRSRLTEYAGRASLFYMGKTWSLEGGVDAKQFVMKPLSEKVIVSDGGIYDIIADKNLVNLVSTYMDYRIGLKKVNLSMGVRGTRFSHDDYFDWSYNFRTSLEVEYSERLRFNASYDQLSQYHHILEGLPVGWSLDLIVPFDERLGPEYAEQFSGGGYWRTSKWTVKIGAYYKRMFHLVSYKNGTNVFGVSNTTWNEEAVSGKGHSYGLEVQIDRETERWNTSAAYTLSRSFRRFSEINQGKVYPFKFDRPHILNASVRWRSFQRGAREHWAGCSVSMSSGHNATIPLSVYKGIDPPYWNQQDNGMYVSLQKNQNAHFRQLMSDVNEYKMPLYCRIDLSYSFTKKSDNKIREIQVGIFNVLNRENPYLVFYEDNRWQQLSIFPITPSVKWSLMF